MRPGSFDLMLTREGFSVGRKRGLGWAKLSDLSGARSQKSLGDSSG